MMHAFRREWTGILVLVLLYTVSVLAVPPVGEFPHGDDWDYAFTAKELVEYGEIRLSDLPACPLVAHVLWGALFVRLFGYSYLVLRLSTLTISFVGTVSVYVIARRFQCTRAMSVLVAAAIGLNPTTLCLSYTFMTDVTANALMLAWLAVLVGSGNNWLKYSLLGVLAAACYLVRQTAWIPAALFTAISLLPGRLPTRYLLCLVAPQACGIGGYYLWLYFIHGVPYYTQAFWASFDPAGGIIQILGRCVRMLTGTALSIAPVTFWWLGRQGWSQVRAAATPVIAVVVALVLWGLASPVGMKPYFDGSFFDLGLGLDGWLPGRELLRGPAVRIGATAVSIFQVITTLLAITSCALAAVAVRVWMVNRCAQQHSVTIDSFAVIPLSYAAAVLVLTLRGEPNDRYVLPASTLAALGLAYLIPGRATAVPSWSAWLVLVAGAAFGLWGTQDYLARSGAVWQAIETLHAEGIAPDQINGGLEYAGIYHFSPHYRGLAQRQPPFMTSLPPGIREDAMFSSNSYYIASRRFTISLVPLPGHRVKLELPYESWLLRGRVYVLERTE